MDDEILIKWMNTLKPSTFFIPDVWEDSSSSIENAIRWANIEVPSSTTKCAVVQANSISDAQHCVNSYIDLGYKKIAFSYGASYYNEICPHPNKDFGKAMGRFMAVNSMKNHFPHLGISVHLLGTAWPVILFPKVVLPVSANTFPSTVLIFDGSTSKMLPSP